METSKLKQMVWLKVRLRDPKTNKMGIIKARFEWDHIDIAVRTKQEIDKHGNTVTVPTDNETITISGKRRNFKEMEIK